ncbi:hypothetical protein ACO0OL_003505 [Hanseniaspora opuntiae]
MTSQRKKLKKWKNKEEEDYFSEYEEEPEEEAIPIKSKRVSARINKIEEPEDNEDELEEDQEEDIEDDKDLVREEKLRMRRALAERKLQEDKRLVLNKLLKRRVGATRGNIAHSMTESKEDNPEKDETPQPVKKVKLPRRLVYKNDGSIIYHME